MKILQWIAFYLLTLIDYEAGKHHLHLTEHMPKHDEHSVQHHSTERKDGEHT